MTGHEDILYSPSGTQKVQSKIQIFFFKLSEERKGGGGLENKQMWPILYHLENQICKLVEIISFLRSSENQTLPFLRDLENNLCHLKQTK